MDDIDKIRHDKKRKMLEKIQIVDQDEGKIEANGKVVDLTDSNFNDYIQKNDVVLVDCWAEWCGPCRMLAPTISELAHEYSGKAGIAKLNVDFNPQKAREYGIQGIPTMLLFKQGKLVDRIVGVTPKPMISTKIDHLL